MMNGNGNQGSGMAPQTTFPTMGARILDQKAKRERDREKETKGVRREEV